jgi:2-succinyl-5-enolpyruvyl-6-hydroxy-3-cyclohexene-1-carboxylate synthase
VKLGQAPVADPAANVLTVTTGAGPVTVDVALDDPLVKSRAPRLTKAAPAP